MLKTVIFLPVIMILAVIFDSAVCICNTYVHITVIVIIVAYGCSMLALWGWAVPNFMKFVVLAYLRTYVS